MKCDDCKFQRGEPATMEYPYPTVYCAKGHWEGQGDGPEPDVDPWANCPDFELWNGPQTVKASALEEQNRD